MRTSKKNSPGRGTSRDKLNAAAVRGCFIVAAVAGVATESVGVFVCALVVLLGCAYVAGDLR